MQARYTDSKCISVAMLAEIRKIACSSFDTVSDVERFVLETLGDEAYDRIRWGESLIFVCDDLVKEYERQGSIGLLLEQLLKLKPDNKWLERLITALVRGGELTDTTPRS